MVKCAERIVGKCERKRENDTICYVSAMREKKEGRVLQLINGCSDGYGNDSDPKSERAVCRDPKKMQKGFSGCQP